MAFTENINNNNALAALTRRAAPTVLGAIKNASAKTGVNFAYLVEQAAAESSFNPAAKAKTSSAAGLYQFIESTWLNMVEKHGDKYGLGGLADKIKHGLHKQDPALKDQILSLRNDPQKAAAMAAELAADNQSYMESQGIHDIGAVELYLAHFMGAGGATAFLKAREDNPLAQASDLFPKEARANRNVFYDNQTGKGRSLAGVYDFFAKKFVASSGKTTTPVAASTTQIASAAETTTRPIATEAATIPALSLYQNHFARLSGEQALALLQPTESHDTERTAFGGLRRYTPGAPLVRNPIELMMLAQLSLPGRTAAPAR